VTIPGFWFFLLLFTTGLAAGFVDSVAGGGGLITLPVLLTFIPDPKFALGTNKLQASFGSGSATWHYARAKVVPLRDCFRIFLCTVLGAALGTLTVQWLDPKLLKQGLPFVLVSVALYVLLKPELGQDEQKSRIPRLGFDLLFGLILGFYDGLVGPGAGTFWTMAFVLCLGFNLTKATGYTKVVNFASNLTSLAFFLALGKVYFAAGVSMGAGQFLGARLGSRMVVTRGTKFIRPVFITVVLALTLKLLLDNLKR
jgi:uncharacterized membrane protein YfcA